MDDQTSKIVAQAVANLAEVAARNTANAVSNKIKAIKASKDQTKTINELDDLINNLIQDKIELERIAKTLENELVSQRISDSDINFIVNTVIPMVEDLTKSDPRQQTYIDAIKKLLSKESLKVAQLIGFDYREAIGIPLTKLCANAIRSIQNSENKQDLAKLSKENEIALIKLSQDGDSYNRFARLIGRNDLIVNDPNNGPKESSS